jgi:hypothetical protein
MNVIIEGLIFIAIGVIVVFLAIKAVQGIAGDDNAD